MNPFGCLDARDDGGRARRSIQTWQRLTCAGYVVELASPLDTFNLLINPVRPGYFNGFSVGHLDSFPPGNSGEYPPLRESALCGR
jgi:hypothetical protein